VTNFQLGNEVGISIAGLGANPRAGLSAAHSASTSNAALRNGKVDTGEFIITTQCPVPARGHAIHPAGRGRKQLRFMVPVLGGALDPSAVFGDPPRTQECASLQERFVN